MNEMSYVVVFPTIFSKNKIPQLISNIKTEHKDLELNIANALEPYRGKHHEKNLPLVWRRHCL